MQFGLVNPVIQVVSLCCIDDDPQAVCKAKRIPDQPGSIPYFVLSARSHMFTGYIITNNVDTYNAYRLHDGNEFIVSRTRLKLTLTERKLIEEAIKSWVNNNT